jgi:hypothetical protein
MFLQKKFKKAISKKEMAKAIAPFNNKYQMI